MRIEIKDIKKGDIFYEACYGQEYGFQALSDACRIDAIHGWEVMAEMIEGPDGKPLKKAEPQQFFVCDRPGGYGPRLSSTREYNMRAHE